MTRPFYPEAYINYLYEFHCTRDYFECHEILEEYWLETGREKHWLVLIQLAVAVYHERRGNLKGSRKLLTSVLEQLDETKNQLEDLGIHTALLKEEVADRRNQLSADFYVPFNLPLHDASLEQYCLSLADQHGTEWKWDGDIHHYPLIHRHKLRDRSEVIEARNDALLAKRR
ncbi:DUF309 domain-containing protein [Alkalicoccus urumqiensis]|uniref:DUF309 domain-containing protein n=1 Tax=Alkalicoccus urumqiensis TaxID=1548213 RepID=UPI0015E5C64A|nr:DUF309 domain-containing protein [Alkalicoccus urumqiensis]